MFEYDYREVMKDDIIRYIEDNVDFSDYEDYDDLEEGLNDALFESDYATGNASGSYTCCTYTAEEYICHNWDLLREALMEYGEMDVNILVKGAEWCDLTIRCYLLPFVIGEVIGDLKEAGIFEEVEDE